MEKGTGSRPPRGEDQKKEPSLFPVLHVPQSQLDTVAYDACVQAAPDAVIYALSWWLDLVSPGWEALVLPSPGGGYRAVMPIPVRRKYGFQVVQQPLFCQFLGIFSVVPLTPEEVSNFSRALIAQYRFVVRMTLRPIAGFEVAGTLQPFETHVLRLDRPHDQIRAGYSRDRKLNLKRAQRAEWEPVEGHEIGTLIQLFRENHEHRIEGGADPAAYPLLERLFKACEARGFSTLRYARRNGKIEAGTWFVNWGGRVIYLFNAASEVGRQGNARTFLIDQFLEEKAGTGLLFDFESPDLVNIAGFYQSFGTRPEPLQAFGYNHLPIWVKAIWKLKKKLSR